MKIGDLVRYAGTRDGEFLGLVTKESRIQPNSEKTIEHYVIWVNVDNEGWWNADLLEKVESKNV
jgi:hypothetical protein